MMFRQEGDMGRYVAFNDPGQPGAGFSSLEEYLAAGNQMPQLPNFEPLKAADSGILGLPKLINTSGAVNPIGGSGGFLGDGSMEQVPIDPIMQGFQDSEFRKNANMLQQDAVNFKYKGQDMMMNGSMAGAFKQYLDSIGKGDLYESELSNAGPLATVSGPNDRLDLFAGRPVLTGDEERVQAPPILDGTRSVNPIVSGPEGIESTAIASQQKPFDRMGQQMINFDDMFGPLNTRLNKIEEGIASLLQNRGQGLNMNTMPTRNFNNFFQEPIGTFPFRSFYG